jgi:hypothetical protein
MYIDIISLVSGARSLLIWHCTDFYFKYLIWVRWRPLAHLIRLKVRCSNIWFGFRSKATCSFGLVQESDIKYLVWFGSGVRSLVRFVWFKSLT